jgi:hypothetical protein
VEWNGTTFDESAGWLAYDPGFQQGIFVAAGDVLRTSAAQIITGADAGEGPYVIVWTGSGLDTGVRFFAYDPAFTGGVRIAAGDVNGSGVANIVTGPGAGQGSEIRVFTGMG